MNIKGGKHFLGSLFKGIRFFHTFKRQPNMNKLTMLIKLHVLLCDIIQVQCKALKINLRLFKHFVIFFYHQRISDYVMNSTEKNEETGRIF